MKFDLMILKFLVNQSFRVCPLPVVGVHLFLTIKAHPLVENEIRADLLKKLYPHFDAER